MFVACRVFTSCILTMLKLGKGLSERATIEATVVLSIAVRDETGHCAFDLLYRLPLIMEIDDILQMKLWLFIGISLSGGGGVLRQIFFFRRKKTNNQPCQNLYFTVD